MMIHVHEYLGRKALERHMYNMFQSKTSSVYSRMLERILRNFTARQCWFERPILV